MVAFTGVVPGASGRDHAAARRLAGRPRGGAAGRRAVRPERRTGWPAARRSTGRASCTACGATSRRPRRRTARRAGAGWEPQPGLALLRLAQGQADAAAAAIRRALGEAPDPLQRAGLLPAYVEIMLAAGDVEEARARLPTSSRSSPRRYDERHTARRWPRRPAERSSWPRATRGAALAALRQAWQQWHRPRGAVRGRPGARAPRAGLPRPRGRGRCRDGAGGGARVVRSSSARRRTSPASMRSSDGAAGDAHGLTPRELQVLRLVAAGKTNKAIAAELVLSEKTVDRHVSNILVKLGVSLARRRHRLRVRAQAPLSPLGGSTHAPRGANWVVRPMRRLPRGARCRRALHRDDGGGRQHEHEHDRHRRARGRTRQLTPEQLDDLEARVEGPLLRAGDEGWDEAVLVWNGMVAKSAGARRSAGLGRATSPPPSSSRASTACCSASRAAATTSPAPSIAEGGLTLDMSRMRDVTVDPGRQARARRAGVPARGRRPGDAGARAGDACSASSPRSASPA